jgi:Enoyl-CoA hydratase/isomerase
MARARFMLDGHVGEIVIADPPLNLFGLELSRDLASAAEAARDSPARAVLVRAKGENFSAGANVAMFVGRDEAAARELIEEFMPAVRRFAEIEVPTVAAVHGLCLAARLEVASCDLIWAAQDAQQELLGAGEVEWTVLRPPRLTDRPATGHYRTSYDPQCPGRSPDHPRRPRHRGAGPASHAATIRTTLGIANYQGTPT